MVWRIYGARFESVELANTNVFNNFTPTKNILLLGIRTWIIINNNTSYSNLSMDIYSNDDDDGTDAPGVVIASSTNNWQPSEIATEDYAAKEIYFDFDNIPLNEATKYNLVLKADGYVYTSTSFLAWRKAWPDPIYRAGYTPTIPNMGRAPYEVSFIGAEF